MSRDEILQDMNIDRNTFDNLPRQDDFCYPETFNIGDKVKFKFGNQRYSENWIYGTITKVGYLSCDIISESGLYYHVWQSKLIRSEIRDPIKDGD